MAYIRVYVGHSCICRHTRPPLLPIKFNQQFLIVGFAGLSFAAILLPHNANAFWPFSTNADAAAHTLIPSASTPALVAAINRNPNASAPIAFAISGGSALVPYGGHADTTGDIANVSPPDRISVYPVRSGDTLSDIANMFDVSINTIIWANNLKSARDVHPGDILIILPISGVEHTVVKGNTLNSVAKKYGGDANEIAQYNGLDSAVALEIGSTIIIPDGAIAVPSTRSPGYPSSIRGPYLGGGGPVLTGYYRNPVPNGIITQKLHGWNGIDIAAARGTPVYAAADGTVIVARNNRAWNGGYGNYAVITHNNGTQTLYSHMKNAIVSSGQSVLSGQIIGYVGSTGLSTGAHLHFEVRGAANPLRNCPIGSVCSPQ